MKDDLEEKVRRAALASREGRRLSRWERFAAGEADGEERAALVELATEDDDTDALSALAPLDEAWLARAHARIDARSRAATGSGDPSHTTSRVRSIGRRSAPWAGAAAVAIALAAAIALRVTVEKNDGGDLPIYQLDVDGDDRAQRGALPADDERARTFRDGAVVRILLRPARDAQGPLVASSVILDHGLVRPWNAPIEISPSGVVKIEGDAARLFDGDAGDREIVLVVARPEILPKTPDEVVHAESHRGMAVFHLHVRWLGAASNPR